MRIALFAATAILALGCSRADSPRTSATAPATTDTAAANLHPPGGIQPWTPEQQAALLKRRLDGGMDHSFGQFAKMFLVMSRIHLGCGVALMTSSEEVSKAELQSPFPTSYKPTLRELLDAVALQTFSKWQYDPTNKYFHSEVEGGGPVRDLAIFEFTPIKREKPYEVSLAEGWKSVDRGHWLMLVPPDFPVGMDIYEMGTYSSDGGVNEPEFFQEIRAAVALEWAQRVHESAREADLKAAKVGPYDALFFESMVASQLGKDVRWRQWVFMVDNKCYFIMSTILPELDDQIFPDVQRMVASFRLKK